MKAIHRCLSVVLVAIWALTLAYIVPDGACAEAFTDEDVFTREHLFQSVLTDQANLSNQVIDWYGEICYAYLSDMSVYTYRPGAEPQKLCQLPPAPEAFYLTYGSLDQDDIEMLKNTVTYTVARSDGLYGYNVFSGKFGSIDTDGIHWNETLLDFECLNPSGNFFPNRVARSLLTEKRLYTLVSVESSFDGDDYTFFGFDLLTGDSTEYNIEGIVNVCYANEESVIFLRNMQDGYILSKLDISNGILTDLSVSMNLFPNSAIVGGLAYDEKTNTICLAMQEQVFRSTNGGDFEAIAYVSTNSLMSETSAWLLPDGRYVLWLNGVHIRAEGNNKVHIQLVYQGYLPSKLRDSFTKENPYIELVRTIQDISVEELAQLLNTQDSSVDIFILPVDYTYSTLVRKGLAADISTSETIRNDIDSMDDTVKSVLLDAQGHVVAYPAELNIWYCNINEGLWNLAFEGRPFPSNIGEFLDAWIEWERDYADEYAGVAFDDNFDYVQWCQRLLTLYVRQQNGQDGDLDLTDDSLRHAFESLRQIVEIRRAAGRGNSEQSLDETADVASIFQFTNRDAMNEPSSIIATSSEDYYYGICRWDYSLHQMTFSAGDEQKTDGTLYVYVVNPYSERIDEAIRFIEHAARLESDPYLYYAIHPDCNTPYEKLNFKLTIEKYVAEKKEVEEALEKAEGSLRKDLAYMLDYYTQYLADQDTQKWMISAETIALDRQSLEKLDLHVTSLYLGADDTSASQLISGLCQRYAGGGLTLDAFLKELSNKMRMIYSENQ